MNLTALPPIPWSHTLTEIGSIWHWDTAHFIVTVTGDDRSFFYKISDKSSGIERPFTDGRARSFEQAEMLVRETIGKAYPPGLGYQLYAGYLATTFRLGNGTDFDFGPWIGQEVTITAIDADGSDRSFTGHVSINHYDVILDISDRTLKISPTRILRVEGTAYTAPVSPASAPRAGRTYPGTMEPGCTGSPGFMPGMVDHFGITCPIHERT